MRLNPGSLKYASYHPFFDFLIKIICCDTTFIFVAANLFAFIVLETRNNFRINVISGNFIEISRQ